MVLSILSFFVTKLRFQNIAPFFLLKRFFHVAFQKSYTFASMILSYAKFGILLF